VQATIAYSQHAQKSEASVCARLHQRQSPYQKPETAPAQRTRNKEHADGVPLAWPPGLPRAGSRVQFDQDSMRHLARGSLQAAVDCLMTASSCDDGM
jgi:hypothetical protein